MKFSFIMIRIYNSIACGIKLMNFQNTLTMSYDLLEFFSLWKKKKIWLILVPIAMPYRKLKNFKTFPKVLWFLRLSS